jgi:hypothetical protein
MLHLFLHVQSSCAFSVVAHEGAHNYGLQHSGAFDSQSQFLEYGDYSTVMGSGWLDPNMANNGPGWVGLSAPQLLAMSWLPNDAFFIIGGNGVFAIPNSLSSNAGVRAALVKAPQGEFWIEWRQAINQDADLRALQLWFDTSQFLNGGTVLASLLIKSVQPSTGKTQLEGMVNLGRSLTVHGITISHSNTMGRFSVSGFAGGAGNTDATTHTPTPPPFQSCRSAAGLEGLCRPVSTCGGTTASGLCPGTPADVKCCFAGVTAAPTAHSSTTPSPFQACRSTAGRSGLCRPVSTCGGTTASGLCPGTPADVKCCFV